MNASIQARPRGACSWFVDLDEKGQGGIEHALDKQIRSKGEKILVMADARQRWFDGGQLRATRARTSS